MSREVHLRNRPQALPQPSDFALVEVPDPTPDDRQILVRNLWMSVDPYMRGRMRDVTSYAEPWRLNAVADGRAVGRVLESRHPDFAPGDLVRSLLGWREIFVAAPDLLEKLDLHYPHPQHYLSALAAPASPPTSASSTSATPSLARPSSSLAPPAPWVPSPDSWHASAAAA